MIKYQRVKDLKVTNEWDSTVGDDKYTEPGWGDPASYTVLATNMDAELAAAAAVKAARESARATLKGFDKTKIKPADISDVLDQIVTALDLK